MSSNPVTRQEAERRTIRRADHVNCAEAFIDCRLPGSMPKENYAFIGGGVSQSSKQHINLREPHGFNVGGAAMPNGVTNNLHLHFTAEVFICFGGEWRFRWGADGGDGEFDMGEGGILSVPTWIFRGFTNIGADDGFLYTCLGRDSTGGIIWSPAVMKATRETGLALSSDCRLVDLNETPEGEVPPLLEPMPETAIRELRHWTPEAMRERVALETDLDWSERALLDCSLPGGRKRLAPIIGHGLSCDRDHRPRIDGPHGFSMEWLEAEPGNGVLRHRHDQSQVLLVRGGQWRVALNEDADVAVELEEWDIFSVPPGAWRSLCNVGDTTGRVLLITGGDGPTRPQWPEATVTAAGEAGLVIDPNGCVAPSELMRFRAG